MRKEEGVVWRVVGMVALALAAGGRASRGAVAGGLVRAGRRSPVAPPGGHSGRLVRQRDRGQARARGTGAVCGGRAQGLQACVCVPQCPGDLSSHGACLYRPVGDPRDRRPRA